MDETAGIAPDPVTGVITVRAQHRLPSDVVGELMEALASEPRIVVCDLPGMSASFESLTEVFAPVASYLANWPGTLVVVRVADRDADAQMLPVVITHRLLVHVTAEDGIVEAQQWLRPVQHTMTYLNPNPNAASQARRFTTETLRDWQLPWLVRTAVLVASELVTDSMLNTRTVLALSLSRCDESIRIAVHDHGYGGASLPTGDPCDETLKGRGMVLVQALTRSWGVLPERKPGKTVWAVMDAA